MKMKCLFATIAAAALAVGLSACDDGKIYTTNDPDDTDGSGSSDATLTAAVQRQVFDAHCSQCHGGANDHAAAGLFLTDGVSESSLVNQESVKVPGEMRLVPGSHARSILWQTVATDLSKDWGYNHSAILDTESIYLMATWIDLYE